MKRWTSKPSGVSASSSTSNTSPVAGVTLGQAASRRGEVDGIDCGGHATRPSIAGGRNEMPKLDLDAIEQTNRTGYPPPYDAPMAKRHYRRLAPAGGTRGFRRQPCRARAGRHLLQRHWHEGEDELVVMLAGEAVLIEDEGETLMRAGRRRGLPQGRRQRPPSGQPLGRALHLRRGRQAGGDRLPLSRHRHAPGRGRAAALSPAQGRQRLIEACRHASARIARSPRALPAPPRSIRCIQAWSRIVSI